MPDFAPDPKISAAQTTRPGLLGMEIKLSNPSPTAGCAFNVYLLVTNTFDRPIWPESPSVFLPAEILTVGQGRTLAASVESLQVLIDRAARGDAVPRDEIRQRWRIPFPFRRPPNDENVIAETIVCIAKNLKNREEEIARLSDQIERLKQSVSGPPANGGPPPKADEVQDSLKKIVVWTLEANNKKQEIERLTKQLISLTGTSVLVAEQDLVLSNFSVPQNFYIRANGKLTLDSPIRSRLQALDQSVLPGSPLQPGDTAVFSICLQTRESLLFRPIQYQLQYSLNYSFDSNRLEKRTSAIAQVMTIRAPITSVMIGSMIGGVAGFIAHYFQEQPQGHVGFLIALWNQLGPAFLTVILSAVAVVFLARKSDTQSMVSIEDFWGGVVIGFLIGYTGTSVFQHIMGGGPGEQPH